MKIYFSTSKLKAVAKTFIEKARRNNKIYLYNLLGESSTNKQNLDDLKMRKF